jgi:hypothetical protein
MAYFLPNWNPFAGCHVEPHFLIAYILFVHPNSSVFATLRSCISLNNFILGGFYLFNVLSANTIFFTSLESFS